MIYLDTETVGLSGPPVLIQLAVDDGPVRTVHVLEEKAGDLLRLMEGICTDEVCGFNLSFDWYKLTCLWAILERLPYVSKPTAEDLLNFRPAVTCLRPAAALDLLLHARSGPMQALMERDDVRVRKVPAVLAQPLADALTSKVDLPGIFFARRKDGSAWKVEQDPDDPDFPDVYLKFGARGGLKPLASHLLGVETVEYPLPFSFEEDQWNPRSVQDAGLVRKVADFWRHNSTARKYAEQDVELLRKLRAFWGNPPAGDTNSELAVCVGSVRAAGYAIDPEGLFELHQSSVRDMAAAPRSPELVKSSLLALCAPMERLAIADTTGETLDAVEKWTKEDGSPHPASKLATKVKLARSAEKRADLIRKLLKVGRGHPDFKIIGALSNRMGGSSGINWQGIEKGILRDLLLLPEAGEVLQAGDFSGFEVAIAAAVYGDENLIADLTAGLKIHALFGAAMYNESYEDVRGSEKARIAGKGWDGDLYNPAKHGVFAWMYGAQDQKMAETLRLSLDDAAAGIERFFQRYPKLREGRQRDQSLFCSMTQPNGLGTRVVWRDPAEKVESLVGFPRYFTLENTLTKALFEMGESPPKEFLALPKHIKVKRRDKFQTPGGAVRSALFGAAFQLQARNMRAAGNHRIQSTGASITKELQRDIWSHQPVGVHRFVVRPMNIHDEVQAMTIQGLDLTDTVQNCVERHRHLVPLLKMDWKVGLANWGGLK